MNEYRISAGRVEVRALDSNGDPYPGYSEWVSITPEEIRLHFVKHTPVAEWLKEVLKPTANRVGTSEMRELAKDPAASSSR